MAIDFSYYPTQIKLDNVYKMNIIVSPFIFSYGFPSPDPDIVKPQARQYNIDNTKYTQRQLACDCFSILDLLEYLTQLDENKKITNISKFYQLKY